MNVAAFTYTSDQISADCNFTNEITYRDKPSDVWSATVPAYVNVAGVDALTLAFPILTSSVSIATPGDYTASRWVRRRHYNPYSD